MLLFPLDLGAAHVIVGKVALLTHAHRVEEAVGMTALGSVDLTTKTFIAGSTHIFGVVLSLRVWAVRHRL